MPIKLQYVLCAGFTSSNPDRDSSKAKVPIHRRWPSEHPSEDEVRAWLARGGWVGAVVPPGCVVLDLDKGAAVEVAERLLAEGAYGARTPHGYHLWYRLPDGVAVSAASVGTTVSGVPVTYRVAGRSQVIIPPSPGRTWIREPESIEAIPVLPEPLHPAPRTVRAHALTDDDPAVLRVLPGDDRGAEVLATRWLSTLASATPGARANTAFSAGVVLGGLAAAGRPVDAQISAARSLADAHDAAGAGNARDSLENGLRAGASSPLPPRPAAGPSAAACAAPASNPTQPPAAAAVPAPTYPVTRTGDGHVDAESAAAAILRHFRPIASREAFFLTAPEVAEFREPAPAVAAAFERLTWISATSGKIVSAPSVLRAVTAAVAARAPRVRPIGLHPDGWSDGTVPGEAFTSEVPADPIGEIWELFKDFAFTDADAQARIFAAVISPFLLHYIHGPFPLFLFAARHPGAGKTLCASLIARIAAGDAAGVTAWTAPEELDNAILTAIQRGKPVQVVDNVRGRLASAVLEAAATSRVVEGRVKFGEFKGARCDTVFLLTANEPQLSRDMSRRVVWIGIDRGGAPAPEGLPDVARMASERRPRLVGAVRKLLEDWLAAGAPRYPVRGADSFERWAEAVCGVLHVAGIVRDPAQFRPIDAAAVSAAADETTQEAIALVSAWAAAEEDRGTTGAWREPEEVAAFAREALPRRRGRPDLIARQILVAATTYERLGTWRVEAATDRRTFRVVPAAPSPPAAPARGEIDDTPF